MMKQYFKCKTLSLITVNGKFLLLLLFAINVLGFAGPPVEYEALEPKVDQSKNQNLSIRSQTQEEAFNRFIAAIKKLPWYRANGYKIALPEHAFFNSIYENPESIQYYSKDMLYNIFISDIYKLSDFNKDLNIINDETLKSKLLTVIEKLTTLNKNWGFKIFPLYEVLLTQYGTGGSYNEFPGHGEILLRTVLVDKTKKLNPFVVISHEIVHLGIEQSIIKKYRLEHWEKERLVELICTIYLGDLSAEYTFNPNGNTKVDEFITKDIIVQDVPGAIEQFIKKYPRKN